MGRVNSIESHPQRQKIIDALAIGTPYRDIEKWASPAVTRTSLSRFKIAINDKLRSAAQTIDKAIPLLNQSVTDVGTSNGTIVPNGALNRAVMVAATDPFLQSARRTLDRHERWIGELEDAKGKDRNWQALAQVDRNNLAAQEYAAKLSGRMSTGDSVNVQIVIPATREPQATLIGEDQDDVLTIDIGSK